jgi:colanic acid/amylovoran biosynthesis glycosyltransferase
MKAIYLTSVYPCLSETFIAREMKHLSLRGWDIAVFRIRGEDDFAGKDTLVSDYHISAIMLNPIYWIRGIFWSLKYRSAELAEIADQVRRAETNLLQKLKIVFVLLTTLGIAEAIVISGQVFDHIRAHFLHNEALSAYWLSTLISVPYSITIHTRMIYYPLSLMKKVVENSSFCVGISEEAVKLLEQLRGTKAGVYLIRNGVETNVLQVKADIKSSFPIILAVGRLIPKKGFDTLIKACALLADRDVDFVCHIVGEGSEHNKLARLIRENNLVHRVRLLGALPFDDVILQYQQASMLVAPSRECREDMDGLPTVIIEALGMGIPVVTTPVAGIPDLIKDKETGIIVPPDDEKALSVVISELLANHDLQSSLGSQGQKSVFENFEISRTVEHLHLAMLSFCNSHPC